MPNHASVTIVGHLGHDPAVRAVGDQNVANFSVAVTRKRKDHENTTWYNVSAWGRLADVAGSYLLKGAPVMITGDIQMESYKKNDGTDGSKLAVNARELVLLGRAPDGEKRAEATESAPPTVSKAMQQAQATSTAGGQAAANANEPPF
jgi:single-strand DNA-binding protein